MVFKSFKYKFNRIKKYYERRRIFKYLLLKIFKGYKILSETASQRKITFNNLIFEYPVDNISYEISINPQNEILVDSYINIDKGTFIDVGAFIGKYTIKMGKNPNVKVLAIEPNPVSFGLLMKNINLNKLNKNVIALNCALSDSDNQTLNFLDNYAMSKIVDTNGKNIIQIKTRTLQSILKEYSPSPSYLIKIDTEGYELKILKSFEKFLADNTDIRIVMEILSESGEKELIFNLMDKYEFKFEQIDYTNYFFKKLKYDKYYN